MGPTCSPHIPWLHRHLMEVDEEVKFLVNAYSPLSTSIMPISLCESIITASKDDRRNRRVLALRKFAFESKLTTLLSKRVRLHPFVKLTSTWTDVQLPIVSLPASNEIGYCAFPFAAAHGSNRLLDAFRLTTKSHSNALEWIYRAVDSHRFKKEDEDIARLYCLSLKENFVSTASVPQQPGGAGGVRVGIPESPEPNQARYLDKHWILHAALCDVHRACTKRMSHPTRVEIAFNPCMFAVGLLREYPLQLMTQYKTKYYDFPSGCNDQDKMACDALVGAVKAASELLVRQPPQSNLQSQIDEITSKIPLLQLRVIF